MEDPVTLVVMLLVLALTFLVFSKSQGEPTAPTATGNGLLGRQAAAPPASARAGHCKIVDTTKLSAVGKAMHANLPQRQGVRSICISGNALVTMNGADMTLAPEVVASLVDVISTGDVFLIFLVTDEAAKAKVLALLGTVPELRWDTAARTGLPPHRILCCTTIVGKIALIRQIEPLLLIEGRLLIVLFTVDDSGATRASRGGNQAASVLDQGRLPARRHGRHLAAFAQQGQRRVLCQLVCVHEHLYCLIAQQSASVGTWLFDCVYPIDPRELPQSVEDHLEDATRPGRCMEHVDGAWVPHTHVMGGKDTRRMPSNSPVGIT